MKTNKSFAKRLKVTKNGKIKRDAAGKCHFNSKESNSAKMAKKKKLNFKLSNKARARFLPKK